VDITIRRCPFSPPIKCQAEGVARKLRERLGAHVAVEEGGAGDFMVLRDGSEVLRRSCDDLPTAEQVEDAVRGAGHAVG
jgi:hypothetical protein